MKPIFIIEHLEPKLYPWCLIEYKSISKIIPKEQLWFTNTNSKKLKTLGKTTKQSVTSLSLQNACILDPEAPQTLSPEEAKQFEYFILGGILGDHPPRKRTTPELTQFLPNAKARNIGKEQLSTDNAVFVTHQILSGIPLSKMKFQQSLEIPINKIESTILPYAYPLINGKPRISKELMQFIKKKGSP
ncbi:MAG TPA: SAM-dependent methyltransferase [Candidatus Nanoarchaeia archaeon]|nr:SAM-dependent methyltransferase [Candidatus Nanoarchaeia archaeon]